MQPPTHPKHLNIHTCSVTLPSHLPLSCILALWFVWQWETNSPFSSNKRLSNSKNYKDTDPFVFSEHDKSSLHIPKITVAFSTPLNNHSSMKTLHGWATSLFFYGIKHRRIRCNLFLFVSKNALWNTMSNDEITKGNSVVDKKRMKTP